MRRYLAESGLQIAFEDLYGDLQDVLDYNLDDFLKAIIASPGLRIADGDEFLVREENSKFVCRLGSVVFDDYTLFVPPTSQTQLEMTIPYDDMDPAEGYAIYIQSTTAYSHPYHVTGEPRAEYAVGHSAVKIILQPDIMAPPAHSYRLALVSITSESGFEIEDHRLENRLTLIGDYASAEWEPQTGIAPQVTNVTAVCRALSESRRKVLSGASGASAVNDDSLFCNTREHYVLDVSWPAPTQAEIDALHGTVYYKVLATPYDPDTATDHLLPSGAIVPVVTTLGRCGCLIPVTPGCIYRVRVYRISNRFHHRISTSSDVVQVSVPSDFQCVMCQLLGMTVRQGYASRDLVIIEPDYGYSRDRIFRLFAREYATVPYVDPDDLKRLEWLVYEGPIMPVNYMIDDWDGNAGVTFLGQIVLAGNQVAKSSLLTHHSFDKAEVDWDNMVVVYAPEFDGDAHDAWPPVLPAQYLLSQFDLGADSVLVKAMTGFVRGDINDPTYDRMLDPGAVDDTHTAVLTVKELGAGDEYTWETNGYGFSNETFTDGFILNADTQVLVERNAGDDEINPSGLYIMLYFKYRE